MTRPVLLFGTPWLLAACGTTFSDEPWEDDADFLNALPGAEQLDPHVPGTLEASACDAADVSTFACLTVESVATTEGLLTIVTELTEVIRDQTPSERGEDYRVWGPGDWIADLPGVFVRVEMSRSPTRSTYSWAYQLSDSTQGPWTGELLTGTHHAGEVEVAAGSGDLVFDLDGFAEFRGSEGGGGTIVISYDVRDLTWIEVVTDARTFAYQAWRDGGGELTYDSSLDLLGGDADERFDLRVRLTADGEGRGDALAGPNASSGGLASASECWAPDGQLTWHSDDFGWQSETGDPADCAFAEPAWPATD